MSILIKVASAAGVTSGNIVFVHGLGGHPYLTWQSSLEESTFWPVWLATDIKIVNVWTLAYDAPPSNWIGNSLSLEDRAVTILERLLSEKALSNGNLIFICHSLGGLVIKQVLRKANDQKAYRPDVSQFVSKVRAVIFLGTPHSGSFHATLLDKLRLVAWPSTASRDLIKNDARLRDLNQWYRDWSTDIKHRTFFETRSTQLGTVVDPASADAGLPGVNPIPIERDHQKLCKPLSRDDLMYRRVIDFLQEEVLDRPKDATPNAIAEARQALNRISSTIWLPFIIRIAFIAIVAILIVQGISRFFDAPTVDAASHEQIIAALLARNPPPTKAQIRAFMEALDKASSAPEIKLAIEEAKSGRTRVSQGIWQQAYQDAKEKRNRAVAEQAEAARNMAASVALENSEKAIEWYRIATSLDPSNADGWLGLGEAAEVAGRLAIAEDSYRKHLSIGSDRKIEELARSQLQLAVVLFAQGKYTEGLKYEGPAIKALRLAGKPSTGDLIDALNSKAYRLADRGELEQADILFNEVFNLLEKNKSESSISTNDRFARAFTNYATRFSIEGLTRSAIEQAEKAIAFAESSNLERPTLSSLSSLMGQYFNLSNYYFLVGAIDKGKQAAAKADQYGKAASAADPSAIVCQKCLAGLKANQAREALDAGDVEISNGLYAEALRLLDAIREIEDSSAVVLRDYVSILSDASRSYSASGKVLESQDVARRSIELGRRLVSIDSKNADYLTTLSKVLTVGHGSFLTQDSQSDAISMITEALSLSEGVVSRSPRFSDARFEVAKGRYLLGVLAQARNDHSTARLEFRRSADTFEEIAAREHMSSSHASDRIELWVTLIALLDTSANESTSKNYAELRARVAARHALATFPSDDDLAAKAFDALLTSVSNLSEAEGRAEKILAVADALSYADTNKKNDDPEWTERLSLGHFKLAKLYGGQGDPKAALYHSRRDVDLARRLTMIRPLDTDPKVGLQLSQVLLINYLVANNEAKEAQEVGDNFLAALKDLLGERTIVAKDIESLREAVDSAQQAVTSSGLTELLRKLDTAAQMLNSS